MASRIWASTRANIVIIARERQAGKTYKEIAVTIGRTTMSVWNLAKKYLDESGRMKSDEIGGYNTTQRHYRLDEWQAVMDMYPKCKYCKEDATEAAHIVAHTKANLLQYGFYAINNRRNMVPTCHAHNARAMQEVRGQVEKDAHMDAIKNVLESDGIK